MLRPASGPPPVLTCDEADNPAGQTIGYHAGNSPFQPPGWDIPVCLGAAVANSDQVPVRGVCGNAPRARLLRIHYRTTTESLSRQLTRYYGDHEFGAVGG
jgi:glyoxylate carboligase